MEWVKLNATPPYYLDGALLRAGEAAEVLFLRALAYAGNGDTRGLVDKTVLPLICPVRPQPRAEALVREALWLDEGSHYRIRSWDVWQDAHDVAAHRRKMDRERKRKERQKKAENADTVRVTSRDRPDPVTLGHAVDREGDREREEQPPSEVVATSRKRAANGTRMPDSWPAQDDRESLWKWALEHAPAVAIPSETANWQDWHRAKGDTAKDWNASWRTWMRRAQKDAEKRPGGQLALVRPANPRVAEQDATLRRWMTEATGGSA